MFGLMNNAYKSVRKRREKRMTVVLLGCDNAGKTTLLHTLKSASQAQQSRSRAGLRGRNAAVAAAADEPPFVPRPTIGFDEQAIVVSGYACAVYDLGGSKGGRTLWPSYLDEVHAVVFVVDAADAGRLDEAKQALHGAMGSEHVMGKPVLVLANKTDLPGALSAAELTERLGLRELRGCPHEVHAVCGSQLGDPRTFKAFKWLGGAVASNYPALLARVDKDVAEKKRAEEQERAERRKRIEERKAQREKDKEEAEAAASAAAAAAPPPAPAPPPQPAQVEMQPVDEPEIGGETPERRVAPAPVAEGAEQSEGQ